LSPAPVSSLTLRYIRIASIAFLLLQPALSTPAHAQASQVGHAEGDGHLPPAKAWVFDVVSIRPSGKDTGTAFSLSPTGFQATHQTLWMLIALAYLPMPLWSPERLRDVPQWGRNEEYDVVAKVAAEDIPAWTGKDGSNVRMAMMQAMLAQRFKLMLHTIPEEIPGFALVTLPHGPKLKATPPDEPLPEGGFRLSAGGIAKRKSTPEGPESTFYAAPMASLADYFSMGAHTTIQDHTGLTGRYDFILTSRSDRDPANHGGISDPGMKWELGLVGLRTVPVKVNTVTLVVDHVERPSEN
jgi:uncharacterized protein (TIGR03435 family)